MSSKKTYNSDNKQETHKIESSGTNIALFYCFGLICFGAGMETAVNLMEMAGRCIGS